MSVGGYDLNKKNTSPSVTLGLKVIFIPPVPEEQTVITLFFCLTSLPLWYYFLQPWQEASCLHIPLIINNITSSLLNVSRFCAFSVLALLQSSFQSTPIQRNQAFVSNFLTVEMFCFLKKLLSDSSCTKYHSYFSPAGGPYAAASLLL